MATAKPEQEKEKETPKKVFIKSVVGPILDLMSNVWIDEANYYENTAFLRIQLEAGKFVEATPGE